FARIFFRNCIATGEVYPLESEQRLSREIETGEPVELDLTAGTLRRVRTRQTYQLRPSGETIRVIASGGLFEYARRTGLVGAGEATR
ncbi:MAG: 3-isopropylmalate dehydratase, partial [Phycisphaerae bacterium]|nr:3-isopropylmalate dehydratase [Phycisphaerae bacterium]